MDNLHSVMIVLPEIVLAIFAMVLLLVGLMERANTPLVIGSFAIFALALTGAFVVCPDRLIFLVGNGSMPAFAFGSAFVDDGLGRFAKLLLLTSSGFALLMSYSYLDQTKLLKAEYPVLVLFATLGMMLMVSSSDFISLYVGLELQSLALYVLAAFNRDNAKSSESGLKYFVLGALSSGLLLYGISLIYGYAGSTQFVKVALTLRDAPAHTLGLTFGMVFVCAGLAFKVSAVPFHMWAPDVYEGAPTPVTAFFSAGPKIAALVLLLRVLRQPMLALSHDWQQVIAFAAVASMILGSFAGLAQKNLKRLMAYSSIANVGYALTGLAVLNKAGLQALLIYLTVYFVNTLGTFGVILCLRRNGKPVEDIGDLAGLSKTNPMLALAMTFFMFSLAGVPPLAGFFGKYFIFLAAVDAHMAWIAIIGVLTSVVSAFYYLRPIKLMYFDEAKTPIDPLPDFGVRATVALAAIYMLVFTIWPQPIIDGAMAAVTSFVR
jgi:NADH-quinone oxidoreductase subunit N